ncbi:hypothetical protein HYY74_00390 [Candidatus Woesearchaeota archaeon]|nr:hypothetical protein [Candidatus Woesearchaeota archaeon]
MGTVTISLKDETERKFRLAVKERLGEGKGKLGRAIEEAVEQWISEKRADELKKRALARLETGMYSVGRDYRFRREEAYEARLGKQSSTY